MMSGKASKRRITASTEEGSPPERHADAAPDDDLEVLPTAAPAAAADDPPPAKKAKKAKAKASASRSGEAQLFENGVLRCLVVENFMAHQHLRVDFDPHVNFIVGKNGSGKSAIINALIAGFGHKASATGRSMNKSSKLIMDGKEYALISIHIANGGEDAFKPDEFGDTIVAEHRLERNGANSYRLKDGPDDAKGRKSSRDEFERMCTHFNIQANNPCALLTQEHAKKFLHKGSDADRYGFFLQAANLESRKHDLSDAMANLELQQKRLERAHETMAEKREIAEAAQHEYDGAKKLKELEALMETFEPLLGWAMVADKERERDELASEAEEAARKEAEAVDAAESAHTGQQKLEDTVASLEKQHEQAEQEIHRAAKGGERVKEQAQKAQKQLKKAKKARDELQEGLENAEGEKKTYEEELEAQVQQFEASKDAKQAKQLRELQALHAKIEAEEKARSELKASVGELEVQYKQLIDEMREAERASKEAEEAAAAKDAEHREAKKAKFSRVSTLHGEMAELIHKIEAEHKKGGFERKPLGPLGLSVSVKDEYKHLGPAIELAIHPNWLLSFIVSSSKDEVKLRALMRSLQQKVPPQFQLNRLARVAIRKDEARFPVASSSGGGGNGGRGRRGSSSGASDGAPVTLIETLEFPAGAEGDAWHNLLMDTATAEWKMVFADARDAEKVVYNVGVEQRSEAIACAQYGTPGRKIFKRGGTTGNEYVPANRQMLAPDKQAVLASLETEVKACKEEAQHATRRFREVEAQRRQVSANGQAGSKRLKELDAALAKRRDEYQKRDNESAESAVRLQLQHLTDQRDQASQAVEKLEEELVEARTHVQACDEAYGPLKAKMEEVAAQYHQMMEQQGEIEAALTEARAPLVKSKHRKSHVQKTLAAAKQRQEAAKAKAQEVETLLARLVPQVQDAYGPRIDDTQGRSVEQLKHEQKKLDSRIKKEQAKHGGKSLVRLQEEAAQAKQKFESASQDISNVQKLKDQQQAAFTERGKFFRKECKAKGKSATQDFNVRLSRKGHAGALTFDHDAETLALTVTRNNQDQNSAATSDARNLSGGERSFTTLSFELAMWEFCMTPFRCLDEFDVYMDDTYRKQAVDTLMELCDAQTQRQFLFVTPQDMYPYLRHREAQAKGMPRIIKMKNVR